MDNKEIFNYAYEGDSKKLAGLITNENVSQTDDNGHTVLGFIINGVFNHKQFNNFEQTLLVIKNLGVHLIKFPINKNSGLSSLSFLANQCIEHKELTPLKLFLKHEDDPFDTQETTFVFEEMLALAQHTQQSYAFNAAQEIGKYATNLSDASKGICVEAMVKYATVQSVQERDIKGKTPLFYVIKYGSFAPKNDLIAALKLLNGKGVNLNAELPDVQVRGYSYMHFAMAACYSHQNLKPLQALLEVGGSPFACNEINPVTPLAMAQHMMNVHPFYKDIYKLYCAHLEKNKTNRKKELNEL